MRRREFIAFAGGATMWPLAASAQQAEGIGAEIVELKVFALRKSEFLQFGGKSLIPNPGKRCPRGSDRAPRHALPEHILRPCPFSNGSGKPLEK
jgi:hypothetical protein